MGAVLFVLVGCGVEDRVGDCSYEVGYPLSESLREDSERTVAAARRQVTSVVFDRIVKQSRAGNFGVENVVVADDAERHAQQMVQARLVLSHVRVV